MFIVLYLHRESLRQMINQDRASHSHKIQVLNKLKPIVYQDVSAHGDLKESLILILTNAIIN